MDLVITEGIDAQGGKCWSGSIPMDFKSLSKSLNYDFSCDLVHVFINLTFSMGLWDSWLILNWRQIITKQ